MSDESRMSAGERAAYANGWEARNLMPIKNEDLMLVIACCAAVTEATATCLRFGWDGTYPIHDVSRKKLAAEVESLIEALNEIQWPAAPAASELKGQDDGERRR